MPREAREFTLIFSVEVPEAVTGFGVNEALVLDGKPEMVRFTELLPPIAVKFTVTVPLDPRATVSDEADNEIPKSAVTLSVIVAVWIAVEPVPVIVSV